MGYKRGEAVMVIRKTPADITSYWIVKDTQENLLLQANGLFPKYMDEQFSYYTIDEHFIILYLQLVDGYGVCGKRSEDLKNIMRKA